MSDKEVILESDKPMDMYNVAGVWVPSEYSVRCPHCNLFNWYTIPERKFICHECGKGFETKIYMDIKKEDCEFDKTTGRWKIKQTQVVTENDIRNTDCTETCFECDYFEQADPKDPIAKGRLFVFKCEKLDTRTYSDVRLPDCPLK